MLQSDVGHCDSVDASLGRASMELHPLDDVFPIRRGADGELVLADTGLGVQETCPACTDLERGVCFSKYSRNVIMIMLGFCQSTIFIEISTEILLGKLYNSLLGVTK